MGRAESGLLVGESVVLIKPLCFVPQLSLSLRQTLEFNKFTQLHVFKKFMRYVARSLDSPFAILRESAMQQVF